MKNCTLARALLIAATASTSSVIAADIVLTPPAGGGVAVTNAIGDTTRLRIADDGATLDGNLILPAASSAGAGTIFKGASRFIHNYGSNNTFIGSEAGNFTMTGGYNTASGVSAFASNTTGYQNTASGRSALASNTTGYNNTASGQQALYSNTTGYYNTASGQQALYSNTTGYYNTASGSASLYNNTTGNWNTAIGYGANVSSGALNNATAIGNGAFVNASNKVRLGNTAVTVIEGQVAYTFSSDRNAKENLRTVNARKVLEKLRAMSVTSWNYIGHDPAKSRHYGPMAQDFHAAFGRDEVGEFGTDTTINSGDITAVVMLGLQGLDSQVREDRRTIEALTAEIEVLKQQAARIVSLEQQTARMAKLLGRLSQDGFITTASREERQ